MFNILEKRRGRRGEGIRRARRLEPEKKECSKNVNECWRARENVKKEHARGWEREENRRDNTIWK